MSLVTDSPVNSSSSDDFAAYLDGELDCKSSDSSQNGEATKDPVDSGSSDSSHEEDEDEDDFQSENNRVKRARVEKLEQTEASKDELLGQNSASSSKVSCTHPGFFGKMCIRCGETIVDETGVTFKYIHQELSLANDEVARLRDRDMKNLLRQKKLCLVLDLDHTLLNSTQLMHLTAEEEYLRSQADSLQDISNGSLFMLHYMHMMTKLRPFVRTFLKEASQMFEMYIYTMGDRAYAHEMAKLLDPGREYFHSRVISRDDGTQKHQKGLDIVLGQESAVLILDDTESAWMKHKDNLILMERYHFFASSCKQFGFSCKSLSELKSDESDTDGALASVFNVLRKIHHMFFDELEGNLEGRDVRQVLKTVRKDVLKGCNIVFSRVFPTQFQANNHVLWKMAVQLGAMCSTDLDETVTHVVSTDAGTEKSRWALKNKKFLVHPRWIEATNYLWQKQPEENFSVVQLKDQ